MSNIDLGDSIAPGAAAPTTEQQSQIRSALGIISPQEITVGSGSPDTYSIPNYESYINVNYDDGVTFLSSTLSYAGLYNGYASYTASGNVYNGEPTLEDCIFYDNTSTIAYLNGGSDIFVVSGGLEPYQYNDQMWGTDTGTNTLSYFIFASDPFVPVVSGQIYKNEINGNLYFCSISPLDGAVTWEHVVSYNGDAGAPTIDLGQALPNSLATSAISSVIPLAYEKGGTQASSRLTAVQAMSNYVISYSGSTGLNSGNSGTTVVANNTSNLTLTIASGLPAHTSFKVIRQNTGEVNIAGASGVTLLGDFVSGTPINKSGIGSRYSLVNITQVSSNTYILSGNFKAAF